MGSCSVDSFVSDLFHSTTVIRGSVHSAVLVVDYLLSWLCRFFIVQIHYGLFIPLLMSIWTISSGAILKKTSINWYLTCGESVLCGTSRSGFLRLSQVVVAVFTLWPQHVRVLMAPPPHPQLFSACFFLVLLVGMCWYLTVVLVCISLGG